MADESNGSYQIAHKRQPTDDPPKLTPDEIKRAIVEATLSAEREMFDAFCVNPSPVTEP